LDKYHLADLSYQAERVELGITGGWQDQYTTIFGGLNFIEFRHDEIMVIPIRILEDLMLELHFNLMLFRFGQSRDSSSIINDQHKQFMSSKKMLVQQYNELAKLTLQMRDSLLKGSLKQFGSFLHTGWEIKKRFSSKISSTYIDNLYQTARKAGALGGKVLGAGGGGYLLLYCDPQYQSTVTEALEEKGAKHDPFDFVENGLQVWSATV
jgi:D-glycero-alpha-D-manno-heptose-7-phosphate kinase